MPQPNKVPDRIFSMLHRNKVFVSVQHQSTIPAQKRCQDDLRSGSQWFPTPYNSNVLKVLGIFYINIPYSFIYIYIYVCEIFTGSYSWNIYIYCIYILYHYILSYLNIRNAPSNKSSFVAFSLPRGSVRALQKFSALWAQGLGRTRMKGHLQENHGFDPKK